MCPGIWLAPIAPIDCKTLIASSNPKTQAMQGLKTPSANGLKALSDLLPQSQKMAKKQAIWPLRLITVMSWNSPIILCRKMMKPAQEINIIISEAILKTRAKAITPSCGTTRGEALPTPVNILSQGLTAQQVIVSHHGSAVIRRTPSKHLGRKIWTIGWRNSRLIRINPGI